MACRGSGVRVSLAPFFEIQSSTSAASLHQLAEHHQQSAEEPLSAVAGVAVWWLLPLVPGAIGDELEAKSFMEAGRRFLQ